MAWRFFGRRQTGEQLSGVEARAGFLDRPVLLVLVISIGLVILGFAGAFLGVL